MESRQAIIVGALLAALGVGAGAFGAHWLTSELARRGLSVDERQRQLEVWEVAARYQMYHALGLVAVGLCGRHTTNRALRLAGVLFLVGVVVFSGCLYALVLSGMKVLGAIVPIGGVGMIAGWVALAFGATEKGGISGRMKDEDER
jgi:uncharacterized membrane protein YgdD (TMEM256/DUF423 family)